MHPYAAHAPSYRSYAGVGFSEDDQSKQKVVKEIKIMKLFHRTYKAQAILAEGFKDATGTYGTGIEFTGVWFSANEPLDPNEGAWGDTVLVVEIPEDQIIEYEWVEEGKPYREFLIPAETVNRYGPPSIFDEDDIIK